MRRYLFSALLLAGSFAAFAQDRFVPVERRLSASQLAEVGLSPAQLQALNRVLREAESTAAASTAAVAPVAAPLPANVPAPPAMHLGLDDEPVSARVVGEVAGWQPGTLFTLDNGQQWQVMKGQMKLRKVLQSPQIAVVPGIAGRWFLQVDEDLPKARVFRVR
ncbi:hypothetical protein AAHH21_14595 [Stenotrophomonas sp. BSUC-16]|uniref:Uncharacterized protein n=1 Tax=Stenotrophomonas maltophilia TaxID=40324 RepID=A0A246I0C6_STEMA|nr:MULTISPECIES: hypothetical protein [Stenotrophomonas maltophilia group]MBA0274061.1 hypothetical protein [Stenotrophomonas maltophilia]MCO5736359.1 hypothetical protein [Stenotrophomonas maltophilia]MDT3490446.1 hypothetical protein [Stenotrophomonas maltophilia group sp. msm4]OWQ71252.1 hypothetical protein CEE63_16870 [Stenotrophomonas maltophilia]PSD13321.1 hypothetical protein C7E14_15175 [Stenotrophomonas maltophilia]